MLPINLVITAAGLDMLVDAENGETDPIVITQVGLSETAVDAAPTLEALPGEFKRLGSVAGDSVAPNIIHMTAMDPTEDVYDLRSIALYLLDGTLFAVYGQETPIFRKVSIADFLLAFDVAFNGDIADLIEFGDASFLYPPATETVKGVAELATQGETNAGVDDERIVTPKKLKTLLDATIAVVNAAIATLTGRTITGGGLATGGGDLSANRVITVTAASLAETDAGAIANKAVVPSGLATILANIATLFARTLTGGGLATGGGDLTANRTITVTAASAAEADAGAISNKALTPASLVNILAAIAGKVGYTSASFGSNTVSVAVLLTPGVTMLIQGGTGTLAANSQTTITFPTSFSTAPLCVVDGGLSDAGEGDVHGSGLATTSGKPISNGADSAGHYSWLAIGRA